MNFLRRLLIIFGWTIIISCSNESQDTKAKGSATSPVAVEATLTKILPVKNSVIASGTLLPAEEAMLFSEINAVVTKVLVQEGTMVKKGDMLIKLFDEDIVANQNRIKAQLELAKETVSRLSKLSKVEGVSRQELDQAMLQVSVLESELELNKVAFGRTEIRAPFSGTVGLRSISPGAYVNPSTPLLTIRQTTTLKIDFSVAERFASLIKNNQVITFQVAGDTTSFYGRVMASEMAIDAETRSLKVRAQVNNTSQSLIPGAFAEVKLELGGDRQALFVPTQCIVPQGRKKSVIVIENGVARFSEVETGNRMSEMIEITSGLSQNDTIAITGILFLKPGAPVKISQIKTN